MPIAYLLLGSNVGQREKYLSRARQAISSWRKTVFCRASLIWETVPFGVTGQRPYLNQAVEIKADLKAAALLIWAKKTELELGRRQRRRRWAPREIDIDILLYGNAVIQSPFLNIPHAGLAVRPFALAALSELCGRRIHPVLKETIRFLARKGARRGILGRYGPSAAWQ